MTVLLVHGMGRTPLSMWRLARFLRRAGLGTELFAYATAWQRVDQIVGRLQERLTILARGEYVVVGHSLGGLLLRAAVAGLPPQIRPPQRMIMLGTPNHSPRLARRFEHAWWYRLMNGDAGDFLARAERLAGIPAVAVPCTVIAGTRGINGRWSPFGHEPNDGLVAVSETQLDGADEVITVDARHPFIMNDRRVRELVRHYCSSGKQVRSKK
jgi:pimeloyl-ACP methyl ester carboxylesterase